MSKTKNIYSEKYKKESVPISKEHVPLIKGYTTTSGFIMENGTDLIDGEEKSYLIMKVYMSENKQEVSKI